MKLMSVFVALTCALFATQGEPWADPQYSDNVKLAPPAQYDGIPDCEVGPHGTTRQSEPGTDWSLVSGNPGDRAVQDDASQLMPFIDWGNDVLVDDLNEVPTFGKLATDTEDDGTIWVGVLDPDNGATNDTIYHYYSTNAGGTWNYWNYVAGPSGDIRDFDLKVGSHGGNTYVYTFIVYDGVAGVYLRWLSPTDGTDGWTQIATGAEWAEVSADRNIETPQHLFCGYADTTGSLKLVSSNDGGATFGNLRNVSSQIRWPSVAAGGDGYVYICYGKRDSLWVQVGRYTNNLVSPSYVFNKLDSSSNRRVWFPSVAAARTSPGGSQVAIAHYVHKNTNDNVPTHYAYTTNGGTSWVGQSIWPAINQGRTTWDARYPYVRVGYDSPSIFRSVVTMQEPTQSWDTLVYAFARNTSPSTWEDRNDPNDYRATGEFGAKLDFSSDLSGGYMVYREFGGTEIWADGWDGLAVEEGGEPVEPGEFRTVTFLARDGWVNLNLPATARVSATLYDGVGRRVRRVFTGTLDAGHHRLPVGELARGLYFLELDVNGSSHTSKLVQLD